MACARLSMCDDMRAVLVVQRFFFFFFRPNGCDGLRVETGKRRWRRPSKADSRRRRRGSKIYIKNPHR